MIRVSNLVQVCSSAPNTTNADHLRYDSNPYQSESVAFLVAAYRGEPLPKSTTNPPETSVPKGGSNSPDAGSPQESGPGVGVTQGAPPVAGAAGGLPQSSLPQG
jgi:hypothetical protein